MKRRIAVWLGLGLGVVITGSVAFFLGDKHARDAMSIKLVSPTQAADAMKADRFYTDYGRSTLLVNATISSVSARNNDEIVEFKTDSPFHARCNMGDYESALSVGQAITVITEGARADRERSAVLLNGCVSP